MKIILFIVLLLFACVSIGWGNPGIPVKSFRLSTNVTLPNSTQYALSLFRQLDYNRKAQSAVLSPFDIKMTLMYFQYLRIRDELSQDLSINKLLFNGTAYHSEHLQMIAQSLTDQVNQGPLKEGAKETYKTVWVSTKYAFTQERKPVSTDNVIKLASFKILGKRSSRVTLDYLKFEIDNPEEMAFFGIHKTDLMHFDNNTLIMKDIVGSLYDKSLPLPDFSPQQMLSVMVFNEKFLNVPQDGGSMLHPFYKANGDLVKVSQFYIGHQTVYYSQEHRAHFIRLFYSNHKYSMLIVMPSSPTKLSTLISKLSLQDLDDRLKLKYLFKESGIDERPVSIPRFGTENNLNIGQLYQRMNLTFDRTVKELVQMNRLYTSESGTFNQPKYLEDRNETKSQKFPTNEASLLMVDRPFVFFIVAGLNDNPFDELMQDFRNEFLYAGYVNDPGTWHGN